MTIRCRPATLATVTAIAAACLTGAGVASGADRRCGSVGTDIAASGIRARNMGCGEARALAHAIETGGAGDVRRAGWRQHYRGYYVWWTKGRKRFSYYQTGTD